MRNPVSVDLLYLNSGFCVGVLVRMTDIGRGSLMTPFLILGFCISRPEEAGFCPSRSRCDSAAA
jgi:hypothetical protein